MYFFYANYISHFLMPCASAPVKLGVFMSRFSLEFVIITYRDGYLCSTLQIFVLIFTFFVVFF